jgi:hypothetical protein
MVTSLVINLNQYKFKHVIDRATAAQY